MKYNSTLRKFYLQPVLLKTLLLTFVAMIALLSSYATNYTSNGSGNWNNNASWTPNTGFPGIGDNVTIRSGDNITLAFANASVNNITLSAGSTITFNSSSLTVGGNWINNGANINYNCACNSNTVIMTGNGTSIGGTSATTLDYLTISTAGTVSLATSGLTIANSGILYLTSGAFKVGAGNIIKMGTNGGTTIDATGGGSFATTGVNGSDGGTIEMMAGSGNTLTVLGSPTFYNVISGNGGDANWHLALNNAGVRINGTLSATDLVGSSIGNSNQWSVNGPNAPIYGPASTLIVNSGGQQYSPGSGNGHYEWLSIAPGSGTIGTTPGYPNNVIIANAGNSASNYNGNQYGVKLSGNWSVNGTFQVGTPTIPGLVDLDNGGTGTNNFSSGGITIEPNSKLAGPTTGTFNVNGNWSQDASATYTSNNGTIIFGGAGTDNISMSSGTETSFSSVTVNANVNLNSPVTLSGAGVLTLTSGVVTTTAANPLTVTNTSTTAITGGSAATYVNGPLAWTMGATTTNNYIFPVGGSGKYLPLTISPNSTSSETATVQAFGTGAPGTPDGTTVSALSTTEYWSVSTTAPFTTGASVSVTRSGPVAGYNALAKSTTAAGVYSAIGGAAVGNTISNASLGTTSPWFLSMVTAPLSVQAVSSTNVSCSGGSTIAGSLTVQGSGGTQPYQYQLDGGGYLPAVPTSGSYQFTGLSQGAHTAFVKDNSGATAGPVTVTVLGSLQINNNNDTTICSGANVPMTAYNLQSGGAAPAATYSWTSIPAGFVSAAQSINPSPIVTTQYVVSSQLYTNLIVNPGFEAGAFSGFTTDYSYSSTSPYGAAPGGHGGLYYVTSAANNMCIGFTAYTPHSGSQMLVCDGPINGVTGLTARVWEETLTVTPLTTYTFSYYYGYADNTNLNQIQANINGVALPAPNPVTMAAPWNQATYTWTSGAGVTSAKIDLYDVGPNDNQDLGNDFMLDDMAFYSPCPVTDTMKVTVVTTATAGTVTAAQTICSGSTPTALTLGANAPAAAAVVSWQSSTTAGFGAPTTIAETSHTLSAADMGPLTVNTYYRAVVQSCPTNVFSNAVLITVGPIPTLTITNPAAVCSPSTVDLTAAAITAGSTGGTTLTYYTNAAATIVLAGPNAVAASGTYYIKSTTAAGCSVVQPVTVTINPQPTLTITNPAAVCSPSTVDITAAAVTAGSTGGTTLTYYTNAAATIVLAGPNAVAASGTYYIKSATAAGCSVVQPVTVTINPLPTLTITNPAAACSPSTVDITAAAVTAGSTGGTTLTYYTNAGATIVLAGPNAVAASGTYYIKSTTAAGCSVVQPVTVTINPKPTLTITNPAAVCSPSTVDITAAAVTAGSTGGTTLTYYTNAGATIVLAGPAAVAASGTYYIKSTTAAGCSVVQPVTVTINPQPTLTITNPAAACSPSTVDITAAAVTAGSTGGTTLTYYTNAGATIVLAGPAAVAASGTYYIKSTTASGCSVVQPVVVTINPTPTLTITNPAAVCSPSTVDITAAAVTAGSTGGTTLTYYTNAGATIVLAGPNAVAASGTYYIKSTTAAGCSVVQPVTVTINPTPTLTITNPAAVCSPSTVDITAAAVTAGSTGGTTLTYYTNAGATIVLAGPAAVAASGTYYIKSATAAGCSVVQPVVVTINPTPTLTITNPAAVCSPSTVDITAAAVTAGSTGGTTLTYYTNAGATIVLAGPAAVAASGTYYIKSTTAAGCNVVQPVTVTINPTPTLTITNPAAVCSPSTVDITAAAVTAGSTGGTTLTYYTNAGATIVLAGPAAVAASGTYYIKSTTAAGCNVVKPVTVTINATPVIGVTSTNPTTCATSTGTFTVSGLTAGATYTINFDKAGVAQAAQILVATAGGTVTVTTLPAGSYTLITATSAAGCVSNTGTATLSDPAAPTPTAGTGGPVCAGNTLSLSSTPTVGASYSWSGPNGFTSILQNPTVPAAVYADSGSYTVTVTLAGCTGASTIDGVVNPTPTLTITNPAAVCSPSTVDITAAAVTAGSTGGTTLTYYTNAGATIVLAGPAAVAASGTYYIKSTTAAGCNVVKPVTVTINATPVIGVTSTNPTTCATSTGTFTVSGLTAGATYTINFDKGGVAQAAQILVATAGGTVTVTTLPAGSYTLITATSAAGCVSNTGTATLSDPAAPTPTAGTGGPVCAGNTLSLSSTPTVGASYSWSGPNGFTSILQNPTVPAAVYADSGSYTVTVTLAGCTGTSTIDGVVNPTPVLTITNPAAVCAPGGVDLTVAAVTAGSTLSGGTLSYYTNAAATLVLALPTNVTVSGTYYIKALTGSGCSDVKPVTVTINAQPSITVSSVNPTTCATSTGSFTVSGLTAAATYTINFDKGGVAQVPQILVATAGGTVTVTTLPAGNYTLITATSAAGCISNTGTATLSDPSSPVTTAGTLGAVCSGNTLSLTANTIAGASYAWTGPNSFVSLLQNPTIPAAVSADSGTYNLTITLAGCTGNSNVVGVVNPTPVLTITNPVAVCAPATVDITAAAVTAGSTLPPATTLGYYTDAAATIVLAGANAVATSGTYYIKALTGSGCSDIKPVTVTINPQPTFAAPDSTPCDPDHLHYSVYIKVSAGTVTASSGVVTAAGPQWIISGILASDPNVTLTVTTVSGCTNTVVITSPNCACPSLPITVTSTNPTTCGGTDGTFTISGLTAATTYTVNYDKAGVGQVPQTSAATAGGTITISNLVQGSYTNITATIVASGCVSTVQAATLSDPAPPVTTAGTLGAVCSGNTLSLTANTVVGAIYAWTGPNSFTSALQNPTIPAAVSADGGSYSLTITLAGCTGNSNVVGVVNPTPVLTITNPVAVCAPGTVDITAAAVTVGSTAGTTLSYYTDAAATIVLTTPTAVSASGTYYIKSTTGLGCSVVDPVTVTINPLPTLTITNPAAVCSPSTVDITAAAVTAGSTGGTTLTYYTDAAATLVLAAPTAVSASGTYYIKSTTASGCSVVDPVTVTINPVPVLVITNPGSVCSPGTVDITAAAVTAGSTLSGGSLSYYTDAAATLVLATPTAVAASGTYYIKALTGSGCSAISPVTVTINPTPVLVITNPGAVCSPSTVDITAPAVTAGSTLSGGSLSYYTDAAATLVLATPTAVAASGTYYIKAATGSGCSAISPVTVTINPTPVLVITGPGAVCSPSTVDITAAAVTAGSTLSGGTLSYYTDAAATVVLATPTAVAASGTYYIKALTASGCSAISPVTVTINPTPVLVITNPAAVCSPSTVDITAAAVTAGSTLSGGSLSYYTNAAATALLAAPAAVSANGTYYIKALTGSGCSAVSPVMVTINPLPTLTITSPGAVCSPSTVDITAAAVTAGSTGGTTLSYYTDATATTVLATPTAVTPSGTYYIESTTAAGCSVVKPVTVTINPTPALTITSPAAVCSPSVVDITAAAVTAGSTLSGGILSYYTNAVATSILPTPSAVATSGTYYIKALTASGCSAIAPVTVTINPKPALVINTPASACSPNTVDITLPLVTAGSTLPPGTTLSYYTDAAGTTLLGTPGAVGTSGTYYIKAVTGSGCSDIKPVTVTINPTPFLVIQNPDAVCSPLTVDITNPSVAINNSTLPPNTTLNYYTDDPPTTQVASPQAIATSGTYYIQATVSPTGCSAIHPVPVTIYPQPAALTPTGLNYCQGEGNIPALTVDVDADPAYVPGNTLKWYTTVTGGAGTTTPQYPSTATGGVTLPYFVTQIDVNGCESAPRGELSVKITSLPNVSATVNPDEVYAGETPPATINLYGKVTGLASAATYAWFQGEGFIFQIGTTDTIKNILPPASIDPPLDTTRYYFVATSVENTQCADTVSVLVKVVQHIEIPNIFSPNGDGINDFWDIKNIQEFSDVEVSVFNRYGQFVYKSGDGYRTPWDGKYHGQPLPVGTYFYIIKTSGSAKPIAGDVSIVR